MNPTPRPPRHRPVARPGAAHGQRSALGLLAACAILACAPTDAPPSSDDRPDGRGIRVEVGALGLAGVTDASYRVTVTNAAGATVWDRAGLRSSRYGDGRGALSYVGACDATANPNAVTLALEALYAGDAPVDPATWRDPTPVTVAVDCLPDRDVPVRLDLTVLRDATQGFFDVAISFSDLFCSAKVDCVDAFLHDADGPRGPTAILAWACAAGPGEATYLHLSDLLVSCDGDGRVWVDPTGGPGNMGPVPPVLFQTATYRGREAHPDLEKCYWNVVLGLEPAALGPGCRLIAQATATPSPLAAARTPADTRWPYLRFDVPLTDDDGALVCGAHPLYGPDGAVDTAYSPLGGAPFPHSLACGDLTIASSARTVCGGPPEAPVAVTAAPAGVSIAATGATGERRSALYALPDGLAVEGCCDNPCCGDP